MLKALELVGFKSFADNTRFEFPRGITVVVGPNGSGKSNIVDAIKWVLGEQSVKSLRGKEMADVIFNGSATRRALNTAETTLTFDNSDRRLALDTPEVHITRRVYRSGEGEYLINRQPCRLRDIRDLFAGTGVATEAYSVIEQGKVDVLLQSSPRDRRAIFEEAAGISRFKAKKIEALRRLERVEQNLLRLRDIVDEVESRLQSVRAAGRQSPALQGILRSLAGTCARRSAWPIGGHLGEKLAGRRNTRPTALRTSIAADTAAAETAERKSVESGIANRRNRHEIHSAEAGSPKIASAPPPIETTIEHERTRVRRFRRSSRPPSQAIAGAEQSRRRSGRALANDTDRSCKRPKRKHREVSQSTRRSATRPHGTDRSARSNSQRKRTAPCHALGATSHQRRLTNEISTLEGRLSRTEETRERCQARLAELQSTRQRIAARTRCAHPAAAGTRGATGRTRRRCGRCPRRFGRCPPPTCAAPKRIGRLRERLSGTHRTRRTAGRIGKTARRRRAPAPRKCCNSPAKIPTDRSSKCAACWPI